MKKRIVFILFSCINLVLNASDQALVRAVQRFIPHEKKALQVTQFLMKKKVNDDTSTKLDTLFSKPAVIAALGSLSQLEQSEIYPKRFSPFESTQKGEKVAKELVSLGFSLVHFPTIVRHPVLPYKVLKLGLPMKDGLEYMYNGEWGYGLETNVGRLLTLERLKRSLSPNVPLIRELHFVDKKFYLLPNTYNRKDGAKSVCSAVVADHVPISWNVMDLMPPCWRPDANDKDWRMYDFGDARKYARLNFGPTYDGAIIPLEHRSYYVIGTRASWMQDLHQTVEYLFNDDSKGNME